MKISRQVTFSKKEEKKKSKQVEGKEEAKGAWKTAKKLGGVSAAALLGAKYLDGKATDKEHLLGILTLNSPNIEEYYPGKDIKRRADKLRKISDFGLKPLAVGAGAGAAVGAGYVAYKHFKNKKKEEK